MTDLYVDIKRTLARASLYEKRGNLNKAKKCYENILDVDPANEKAELGLQRLVVRKSEHSKPELEKGSLEKMIGLVKSDNKVEVLMEADRLCQKYPTNSKIHYAQGLIYSKWKMFKEAVSSFRRAVELDPEYVDAYFEMGKIFRDKQQLRAAGICFDRAVQYQPDHLEANNQLGLIQKELGQPEQAEDSFMRALKINPENAGVYNNLGILYGNMGRKEEAKEFYEKALERRPDLPKIHKNLSLIKKFTPDDPQIAAMEKILLQPKLGDDAKVCFRFALAKAYEDIGDPKRCTEYLEEGGKIRTKQLNYTVQADKALTERVIKFWSDGCVVNSNEIEYEPAAIKPIFVLGMPRSGTTLSEQILASHSQVHGAGELWEFGRLIRVELMKAGWLSSSKKVETFSKESVSTIRRAYLKFLEDTGASEKIVVDKMPLNFRWVGFIQLIFPEAKIVHQVRSPMATCWSCYKFHFTDGNGFTFDQKNLARFYNLYLDLMEFWRDKSPREFYDLNYEALTHNQEEETRKLLEYCELDWEDQCLNFHKTERKVSTASQQQVREKMYTGSSEAWKKFEPYLQDLIEGLNSRDGEIIH